MAILIIISLIFRLPIWPQAHHSLRMKLSVELRMLKMFLLTLTTPLIAKYVGDHSSSIGCPKQFFLIPLQSIAAHFMGPKAYVKVHEGWSEPIIL